MKCDIIILTDCYNSCDLKYSGELCSPAGEHGSPQQCGTKNYDITLGHNMFLILQTIYTHGVRRLAVRYFTNKIEN